MLLEKIDLNKYEIKLEKYKQILYRLIYSLSPIKLEILKIYIKTYLKTGFIWPFKFPASDHILFVKKPNGSLCLYLNCWDLNNLIIKNYYLLLFIGKSLN